VGGILLRRPTEGDLERFLAAARRAPFSYDERGASDGGAPAGYDLDHNRVRLGAGRACFERAGEALRCWAMFPPPWSLVVPSAAPAAGQTVCVQFHLLGLWWLNGARIVYVLDEERPVRRSGFAYGTLACHVERGEERFCVEWLADDSVWYDLSAFSRPGFWAARLARPVARALQRRFVRDSQAAMRLAVTASDARSPTVTP
jgi:uncharacterized protein (UPF0548 family)